MNRSEALLTALTHLAGTDAPRLTAEVLLAHTLGLSRATLLAHLDEGLTPTQATIFENFITRAAQGAPLAYLTGEREFYGLRFAVDGRVLIPRPETELLVDLALAHAWPVDQWALDVGTGSGCIAVTLAVKRPQGRLLALDRSAGALAVAQQNAQAHSVADRITFLENDLLSNLGRLFSTTPPPIALILANLPYIAAPELATLAVARYEPHLALDGGAEGLDLVRRLLLQAPACLAPGGAVLLEIGATQVPAVRAFAQHYFPKAQVTVHRDFAGLERVVAVRT